MVLYGDAGRKLRLAEPELDVLRKKRNTGSTMQLSVNSAANGRKAPVSPQTLAQLREGESGTLDRLELPEDVARRLMELGFLPGHVVVPARSAPGGEPRVYRVDGSEVALRRETAKRLILRQSAKGPTRSQKPGASAKIGK
jgi:ferrous iron transport protein A